VLRVARTIADLDSSEPIREVHISWAAELSNRLSVEDEGQRTHCSVPQFRP
jgi:predicted ATPase with chaperone activity